MHRITTPFAQNGSKKYVCRCCARTTQRQHYAHDDTIHYAPACYYICAQAACPTDCTRHSDDPLAYAGTATMTTDSSISTYIIANRPDTKSVPNPNPDPTTKQHAVVACIQLNIVMCRTYPEKFIRKYVITPFLLRFVIIVNLLMYDGSVTITT